MKTRQPIISHIPRQQMSVQNKPAEMRESSSVDDSDLSKLVFRHFFTLEKSPGDRACVPGRASSNRHPPVICVVCTLALLGYSRAPPARNRLSRERSLTFLQFHFFESFISLGLILARKPTTQRRPLTCPVHDLPRPASVSGGERACASRTCL